MHETRPKNLDAVGLPNQVNIVDVTQGVVGLHLDDVTDGDRLLRSMGPPDADVPLPHIGDLLQQVYDVTAIDPEQR